MSFYQIIYKLFSRPVKAIWRVSAEGVENIPEGGCILVANHTAMMDVLVLEAASPRQIRFMAKKELFKIPLLSSLIKALGAYPVDRGGADVKSLKLTFSMIENGDLIGIFPQGTRVPYADPRKSEIKGGIGMISYHAKATILPAFIDTSAGKTKAFRKNHVIFGKPISFEELGFEGGGRAEYQRVADLIFSKVCELKYGTTDADQGEKEN